MHGNDAVPTEVEHLETQPGPSERGLLAIGLSRRNVLRVGAVGLAGLGLTGGRSLLQGVLEPRGLWSPAGVVAAADTAITDLVYVEAFPTSPLILKPFDDPLPVPRALRPVSPGDYTSWSRPPGPGPGQQSSLDNERHQIWPSQLGYPDPIVYKIDLLVRGHAFTTSPVLPIDKKGRPTVSFDDQARRVPAGQVRNLPLSTIYGFNGTFPGPMINAEYGRPVLVRFENHLDENPMDLDRQDFGTHDYSFLTHLHNGHTAPESDGNPHYSMRSGPRYEGYRPGMSCDNLYLNWPAGGDDREKQSFFWFHDHRMDQTGSNVYKGMVGLYPIYDPKDGMDMGDERQGLRLPGVRDDHSDGSFDVAYDIPLAFGDCRLDDGVTMHKDIHDTLGDFPDAENPKNHPEWWGKTFFKHFPNHGFVGDIFTVNGVAAPVLEVRRRTYRFRFLDASVSRIYEFKLMSSTQGPKSAASLGYSGTDLELWPAKRREVVIDFTRYSDGSPTTKGDVIYLTDVMKMPDGRMWSSSSRSSSDPAYKVPVLKFVVGDDAPDDSIVPAQLRPLPPLPANWSTMLDNRMIFEVQRGSSSGETEWLINGRPFDASTVATSLKNRAGRKPLAQQRKGSYNLWEIRNGGGGWVHPFHLHMEEHRTVMRNGRDVTTKVDAGHPDDAAREDLVALDPGESVIVYRGFRDFVGPYVGHCHNLAHEDHAMIFGWEITP